MMSTASKHSVKVLEGILPIPEGVAILAKA